MKPAAAEEIAATPEKEIKKDVPPVTSVQEPKQEEKEAKKLEEIPQPQEVKQKTLETKPKEEEMKPTTPEMKPKQQSTSLDKDQLQADLNIINSPGGSPKRKNKKRKKSSKFFLNYTF